MAEQDDPDARLDGMGAIHWHGMVDELSLSLAKGSKHESERKVHWVELESIILCETCGEEILPGLINGWACLWLN